MILRILPPPCEPQPSDSPPRQIREPLLYVPAFKIGENRAELSMSYCPRFTHRPCSNCSKWPDHQFVDLQTKDVRFVGTHSIIALGHSLGKICALSIFCVAVRAFKTLRIKIVEKMSNKTRIQLGSGRFSEVACVMTSVCP